MLWSPVAHQRFLNDLFTRMDAVIPQFGQHRRVSLAREDRIYNRQTSDACDFADHMVDLQIHLRQRFLHMLNMLDSDLYQIAAVAHQGPYRADVAVRSECGS